MSKICRIVCMLMVVIGVVSGRLAYADDKGVRIYVDGEQVETDVDCELSNGRVFVPVRGVLEKLQAEVRWDEYSERVYVCVEQNEIVLMPNMDRVLLNGRVEMLDVPATTVEDRLMVPLRFIAANLGHKVTWSQETKSVYIESSSRSVVQEQDIPCIGSAENLQALLKLSGYEYGYPIFEVMPAIDSVDYAPSAEEPSAGAASETNVQVEGVDEGDLIKTDGQYIYVVSNSSIKIICADPTNPSVAGEIKLTDNLSASEIYVKGTKLTVIGTEWADTGIKYRRAIGSFYPISSRVCVYDVSDVASPVLQSSYLVDGRYVSSRLIDDMLYVVTSSDIYDECVDVLPGYENALDGSRTAVGFDSIRYFPYSTPRAYTLILSVDLNGRREPDLNVCLASPDSIYMNTDTLCIASGGYRMGRGSTIQRTIFGPVTGLYGFDVKAGEVDLRAWAEVPGTLLNQFSMDSYDDVFRVAVSDDSGNSIYAFDANMQQLSCLKDLAPEERIYSVRFMGERIYMVTFKQVDPLFVIDAVDPENMHVLGYLKVPGYSTYLHPVSDSLMLGFGYDTSVNAWGGIINGGVKVSLFDVSDVASPVELYTEVMGSAGSYTEVLNNHKALTYSTDQNFMAFPLTEVNKNGEVSFDGALVCDINEKGFKVRCRFENEDINYGYMGINRIIYIGDFFYTFTAQSMTVYDGKTGEVSAKLDYGFNIK